MRLGILLLILGIVAFSCRTDSKVRPQSTWQSLQGEAMGTYYQIKFNGPKVSSSEVDSLFDYFNESLSNYIPNSTISKVSKAKEAFTFAKADDPYFVDAWRRAQELTEATGGYFNPTISPLINYWGFGYGIKRKVEIPSKRVIDSLKALCGFGQFTLQDKRDSIIITKQHPAASINMNASAKGKGVDVVGLYLESLGVTDYLVEVGGEVRTKGNSDRGTSWVIGINRPDVNASAREIEIPIAVGGMSMASSGNYRQFYVSDSIIYGHIIDPYSGYSKQTDLLSVSIVASDCETADAFATACMVMGLDKAQKIINGSSEVEGCLLYGDDANNVKHWYSSDFEQYLLNTDK